MNTSRLLASNPKDLTRTRLSDLIVNGDVIDSSQSFYLAEVVDNRDPKNANRIKVRIPLIDDIFYLGENNQTVSKQVGDEKLPFCISANTRFVETPEIGSIVLVALVNSSDPYLLRVWFTTIPTLETKSLFDRIELDQTSWQQAEETCEVRYDNNRQTEQTVVNTSQYEVGIRGRGKNKVVLSKDKIVLTQSEGASSQADVVLDEQGVKVSGKRINLKSTQSSNSTHHPIFAQPLLNWEQQLLNILIALTSTLSISAGVSPGVAITTPATLIPGNPALTNIVAQLQTLQTSLNNLKQAGTGYSANIDIN